MSNKTSRSAAPEATPATPMPAAWVADWSRQQMAVATASAQAMMRGFDAMRRIHEETAQAASDRHVAIAEKLKGHAQPADVLAAQTELLRSDLEHATRYWQQMTAAAMEMNSEVLGCTAQLVDTEALLAAARGRLPISS